MRRSLAVLSILIVASLVMGACGATPEPKVIEKVVTQIAPVEVTRIVTEQVVVEATEAPPAAGQPRRGGTFVLAQGGDVDMLDPHISQVTPLMALSFNVFDTLTVLNPKTLAIEPRLATDWQWSDNQTLEMALQAGVTFHNGEPFTANDVKYTFERILNPDTGSPLATHLQTIKSVEVIDDLHVRFNLKSPDAHLLAIFPRIPIYTASAEDTIATNPIGTGPFKFVEWVPNDHITLARNENYWMEGLPYLDQLILKPIPEMETRLAALEAGTAQMVYELALKDVKRVEALPGVTVVMPIRDRYDTMYFNNSRAPMNIQAVRQAVAYAFDSATYFEAFMGGLGEANMSPWVPQNWAFLPEARRPYPYDLTKAAEKLVEAGFPGGKGLTIDIIVPVGFEEWKQGSEMLQAALTELGVDCKVEVLEISVWVDRLVKQPDYDISWDYQPGAALDPSFALFHPFFFPPGPSNLNRFDDPEITSLINEGIATLDQGDRKDVYFRFQKYWDEKVYGLVVGQRDIAHGLSEKVKGFVPSPQWEQDFREVWLEE